MAASVPDDACTDPKDTSAGGPGATGGSELALPMQGSEMRRGEQRVSLETMIDRFMEQEGLTLEAMARRAGLSLATIAALRSGTRGKRPRPETVAKLADAMGVDVGEVEAVIGGSGRRREEALLMKFRALSDADKAQVEQLAARLAGDVT